MSIGFIVIFKVFFTAFYYLIFYFISKKFGDKIKLKHCLFLILGSIVILFSYSFYFNYFIKSELTHEIFRENFDGLFLASVVFALVNKNLNIYMLIGDLFRIRERKLFKKVDELIGEDAKLKKQIGYFEGNPDIEVKNQNTEYYINIYNYFFIIFSKNPDLGNIKKIEGKQIKDIKVENGSRIIVCLKKHDSVFDMYLSPVFFEVGILFKELIALKERCKQK